MLSCVKNKLEGTPSWVPDLGKEFWIGGSPVFTDAKCIKFSKNRKQLTVYGRQIGRIVRCAVKNDGDGISEWLRSFEEKRLVPWAESRSQPLPVAFKEWLSSTIRFLQLLMDYFSQYSSVEDLVEGYRKHLVAVESKQAWDDKMEHFVVTLKIFTFCFLEDSEVMVYRDCKYVPRPNDQVWVWIGHSNPVIVRATDKRVRIRGCLFSFGKWENIDESIVSNGDLVPVTLV